MEHVTESGLAVVTRSTVGPDALGFGATHVMYDAEFPPPEAQRWEGWPLGWTPPWSNQSVLAGRVGTVFACVDLNGRVFSSMPPYLVHGPHPQSPLPWLRNPEPERYTDWTVFAKELINSLLIRGEAFIVATARYADETVRRFICTNPDFWALDLVDGVIEYRLGGQVVPPRDVLHIKYQSYPNDLRGHSPLEAAAHNLIGAAAMESYAANLAAKGGVPWGILKHPANLNAAQAEDLQGRWRSAASRRDGAPAVLSGGVELEVLTLSPKEMALLELRIFDETRICSVLGVPPYLVGLPQPSGLTYANATSLFDFHWRATLRPIAQAIGNAISGWALAGETRLEFNRDEYVRPDFGERVAAYAQLHGIVDPVTGQRGITVEEIRAAERLVPPPVLGEDISTSGAALISGSEAS
jgi:HK97 family phage portal protein